MRPGRNRRSGAGTPRARITAGLAGLTALALGLGAANGVQAQSAYGCRGLDAHSALPAVEGTDGMFFSIRPDLQMHHALNDEVIAQMAALSEALALRGTTLVLLPVPSRALIHPDRLPVMARNVGYDVDIATAVHEDSLRRARNAGLAIADLRGPLRQDALGGGAPFFDTDPRPTTGGARVIARVLADLLAAHEATRDLPRGSFTTTEATGVTLPSDMRARLQPACQDRLPQVTTPTFRTTGAADAAQAGVVGIIGADLSATAELNLAGFLSEASGLRAGTYGVMAGGAFAAMSSFLTSDDFAQAPPQVLVWEFPVWADFARHGDQPMRELIAAAGQICTREIALRRGAEGKTFTADLSDLPREGQVTLALDTGGAPVDTARFDFTDEEGQTRSRGIWRHEGQALTGRFFMPLSGLQDNGLSEVAITLPAPFGAAPSLRACLTGATP